MWGPSYSFVGSIATISAFDALYQPGLVVSDELLRKRRLIDGMMFNSAHEHIDHVSYMSLNARFLNATNMIPTATNYFQRDCLLAVVAGYNRLLTQGVTIDQILTRQIPNFNQSNFLNTSVKSVTGSLDFDQNGDRSGQFLFQSLTNGSLIPALSVNDVGIASFIGNGPVFAMNSNVIPLDGDTRVELTLDPSQPLMIILLLLSSITTLVTITSAVLFVVYRSIDAIHSRSLIISLTMLIGILLSLISCFTMTGKRLIRSQCVANSHTSNNGITLIAICLILKANCILRASKRRKIRTKSRNLHEKITGIVLFIPFLVLMTLVGVFSPTQPVIVKNASTYYTECRSTYAYRPIAILVYEFTLMLVGFCIAHKIRHIRTLSDESKYIRLSLHNMILMNLVSRIVEIGFGNDAFFLKFYTGKFVLIYTSIFSLTCLIIRPLLQTITSTADPVKESSKLSCIDIDKVLSRPESKKVGLQKRSIVFVRNESHYFQTWRAHIIYQANEGIILTPLKNEHAKSVSMSDLNCIGLYFCKDSYKLYLHEKLEAAICIESVSVSLIVQFNVSSDSIPWISNLITKSDEVKQSRESS